MYDDEYWEALEERRQEEQRQEDEWVYEMQRLEYEQYMFKRSLVEWVTGGVL